MKHIILAIISGVVLMSGCTSSAVRMDINKTEESLSVTPISKDKQLQLTYRFKENLIPEEYNEFAAYLGTDDAKEVLATNIDDALASSVGISNGLLMHSTVWDNALKSGNMLNVGIGALAVGGVLELATADAKARRKISQTYFIDAPEWINQSATEITELQRQTTVDIIYEFADSMGYSTSCAKSCDFTNNKLELDLTLTNKNTETFYKPSWIRVGFILKPLEKVQQDLDGVLLGQRYQFKSERWFISTSTTVNDTPPEYKTLSDGQTYLANEASLGGTLIYQKLFELLTSRLTGYSNFYNSNHVKIAFVNGKTYKLNEELLDNSIVKGELN